MELRKKTMKNPELPSALEAIFQESKKRVQEECERLTNKKQQVVVFGSLEGFELDEGYENADVLVYESDGEMVLHKNVSQGNFVLQFALQKQLMGHQLDAINKFLTSIQKHLNPTHESQTPPKGLIIAHTMGAGKTTLALTITQCVHKQLRAIAVMSPTLEDIWQREYTKWCDHFDFDIMLFNDNPLVLGKWKKKGGLLIVREHAFRQHQLDDDLESFEPDLIFYDEAHHAKNCMSKNHEAIRKLPPKCYIVLMTGTPYHNDMEEFYHMLKLLGYHWEHKQFVDYYLNRINRGLAPDAEPREKALSRFLLKQLHDEWIPYMHRVDKDLVEGYLQRQGIHLKEINIEYIMHDKKFEAENSSTFDQQWSIMSHTNDAKQSIVLKLLAELEARGQYTVVVSKSKNVLNELALKFPGPILHADAAKNTSVRSKIVKQFQNKEHGVGNDFRKVVYLINKWGEGLDLSSANTMIICDPEWNPQVREQITRRIYRKGQTKSCTIYHLFAGDTIEKYMCAAAQSKEITCAGILDERYLTSLVEDKMRMNQLLQQDTLVDDEVLNAVLKTDFPQLTIKCSLRRLCEDRDPLSASAMHQCHVANLFFAYNNDETCRKDIAGNVSINEQFMVDGTPYQPLAPYFRKRDDQNVYFLPPKPDIQQKTLNIKINGDKIVELEDVQLTSDKLVKVPIEHFARESESKVHFQFSVANQKSSWSESSVIRV